MSNEVLPKYIPIDGLAPCPFCGSTNIVYNRAHLQIECHDCLAEGPFVHTDEPFSRQPIIDAWNKRAAIPLGDKLPVLSAGELDYLRRDPRFLEALSDYHYSQETMADAADAAECAQHHRAEGDRYKASMLFAQLAQDEGFDLDEFELRQATNPTPDESHD